MDSYRLFVALLVAALVVPVCLAVIGYPGRSEDFGYATIVLSSAVVSFCAVLFLRAPAYVCLLGRSWTAFWITPLVGFGVATVVWFAAGFLMALALSPSSLHSFAKLWVVGILWPCGPAGAVVGAVLWLIAQPDGTHD
jgi:hypothetical protein